MLLIQNGTLYTMESKSPVQADLLIHNGKIAKVAPRITPDTNTEIIDVQGMQVYPGFIDAHCHIGLSEEKTTPLSDASNESTGPITPQVRAIDSINPMDSAFHNALAAGITGVMALP